MHSNALQFKIIFSTAKDFEHQTQQLEERFVKQGYNHKLINGNIQKVSNLNRSKFLEEKPKKTISKLHSINADT